MGSGSIGLTPPTLAADTPYPGGVYNLQGRCVATEEQVLDGTWRQHLAPGIYIMNGRSIIVK